MREDTEDRLDVVLMIVGTLCAIANGLSQPLMTLIFGQLINSFGASDRSNIVKEVSKFPASNFQGRVGERSIEFLLTDIGEQQGKYRQYPARPEVQIFSGFSLQVPSGTTTALVGQSGSGKSTVVSLVERFYDPDSGEVLIDGVDLKKLKLSWIREKIGLVSQEPILFATSIKENIAYGKENATDQEIRTAIQLANAAKFIDKMPERLDTMVGENGTQLSGGQKQRIAIARAILKNPKILLLDEATSALDAESERIVQDTLEKIMCNRTTLVVAHRLTTIRNADMIAVVHLGKIVEKGSHEELTKDPEGAYSQLIRLQGGAMDSEESQDIDPDMPRSSLDRDKSISNFRSQNNSVQRSISRGSSGSRRSCTLNTTGFGMPSPTSVHDDEFEQNIERNLYMVIFPVFGLLLSKAINMFYEPPKEIRKDSKFWAVLYLGLGFVTLAALPLQYYLFGIAGVVQLVQGCQRMLLQLGGLLVIPYP
ncbi:hypothetical protein DKX38_025263 [Salix brachista]|uniref:ABC transporter domain-containing protein n=1 Tax=Salix brachista TaxID=2182728 RepID=A0A5N5JSB5_9ROSI|nr:hypothetical protein DKX38_025263 [Salix brachista]